jgi:hypothetical protein
VMQREKRDHHASHSNGGNQFLHLLSSSTFIYCYILAFYDLTTAMCWGSGCAFRASVWPCDFGAAHVMTKRNNCRASTRATKRLSC